MHQVAEQVSVVERLNNRVMELERRLEQVESRLDEITSSAPQSSLLASLFNLGPSETSAAVPTVVTQGHEPVSANIVTTIGKAVLGMAGAYMLRSIAGSGSLPSLLVLFVAVIYACVWMIHAVRNRAHLEVMLTYGLTSVLILAPMLWESTARFRFIPPPLTAAILAGYVLLTTFLSRRHESQALTSLTLVAATITALGLFFATHALAPFAIGLLLLTLQVEVFVALGRRYSIRAVPTLAADMAIALLIYVLTDSPLPEGYTAISPIALTLFALAPLLILACVVGYRSFWHQHTITTFETIQGVFAFAVALFGAIRIPGSLCGLLLAMLCLVFSAGAYWGSLSRFAENTRNRRITAAWAAGLLTSGILLLFPLAIAEVLLGFGAVMAAWMYTRTSKLSLGIHATVYLAAAAAISPLPDYMLHAMSGKVPGAPAWNTWVMIGTAALCYIVGGSKLEENRRRRMLWLLPVFIVGFATACLAVAGFVAMASMSAELSLSALSVVRTIVTCILILALAFVAARTHRAEIGWVGYLAFAFGSLKLVLEDLRIGNTSSLMMSFLFYGLVLILAPKLARSASQSVEEANLQS